MPKKECLDYHIKQCLAPCTGRIDGAGYAAIVSELKLFLEGRTQELLRLLTQKMIEASRKEDFEEASRLKARIEAFGSMKESAVSYHPADEVEELASMLGIKGRIETIEAFDVSNTMGQEAVGSMICFNKGRPRKSGYRRFKIKGVFGVDDYSMMREIVRRRYSRLAEEKGALPDLILIDGGKGHLAAASDELRKLGLSGVTVIGIAKEFEHVYTKEKKEPVILPKDSKALHLLERVRDEAHRFAISYHKSLRARKVRSSELDNIPGIGEKRKRSLLGHFSSVDKIKGATLDELLIVKGLDEKSAKNVIAYFKKETA